MSEVDKKNMERRIVNNLKNGFNLEEVTPEAVSRLTAREILRAPNMGPHSLWVIETWLEEHGLGLTEEWGIWNGTAWSTPQSFVSQAGAKAYIRENWRNMQLNVQHVAKERR